MTASATPEPDSSATELEVHQLSACNTHSSGPNSMNEHTGLVYGTLVDLIHA